MGSSQSLVKQRLSSDKLPIQLTGVHSRNEEQASEFCERVRENQKDFYENQQTDKKNDEIPAFGNVAPGDGIERGNRKSLTYWFNSTPQQGAQKGAQQEAQDQSEKSKLL